MEGVRERDPFVREPAAGLRREDYWRSWRFGDLAQNVVHHGVGLKVCNRSRLGSQYSGIVAYQENPLGHG